MSKEDLKNLLQSIEEEMAKTESASSLQEAQTRVDQTRANVKNATGDLKGKLETCLQVIDEDADGLYLKNDLYIIMMVNKLLQASAQSNGEVVSAMGFDRSNLMQVMQTIFSLAQDKYVPKKQIRSYLLDKKPFGAVVYSDILGLDAGSTKEEMQQRLQTFSSQIEPLDELFDYDFASHVTQTLKECDKAKDLPTKLAIVKKHGFASKTRFHEGDLQGILDDIKNKSK